MRRVFELLQLHPEGLTIKAITEQVDESLFPRLGRTGNFKDEALRRSCIAPLHAGWLTCKHGYHLSVSEAGKVAYQLHDDPVVFISKAGSLSIKGSLSLRFPKAYYFAGKIKDQLLVELRAARRIGVRQLIESTLKSETSWEHLLPLQESRRFRVSQLNGNDLRAHLESEGASYAEGGHAIYLPPASFRRGVLAKLARDYPEDAGLKIVKNPGGIRDSRYVGSTSKGDSQIHLRLVHNHAQLTLMANLLYTKGIGARLYDLIELRCGEQLFAAYVIEHIDGAIPTQSQCEAGIQKLRDLESESLIRVILPEGFDDEEFECPKCCNNALTNQYGEFRYVDFQNFILINYQNYLKRLALEATKASHFGDTSVLRGGRYLYQSVPGVSLPYKRSVKDRLNALTKLMDTAGMSVSDRLVLDVGCNIGMMMAEYLRLGARWCHGWDRSHVIPYTEKLLLALGCTRFSTSGTDICKGRRLEDDLRPFLKPQLEDCVISYLAIRGHIGWLEALARIPWSFLIYEGHEGETTRDFSQHVEELRSIAAVSVAASDEYADGDSDSRIVAILVRS